MRSARNSMTGTSTSCQRRMSTVSKNPVVYKRRPLVLQHTGAQPMLRRVGVGQEFRHHGEQGVLAGGFEISYGTGKSRL